MAFAGCSSGDSDGARRNCNLLGLVPAIFVDNGDGTTTITIEGEFEVVDLEGLAFDVYVDQICSGDTVLDFGL